MLTKGRGLRGGGGEQHWPFTSQKGCVGDCDSLSTL